MSDAAIIQNGYLAGANRAHVANYSDAVANIHAANATIERLNARVRLAEAENARLADMLATAHMTSAGLIAQRDAFYNQHPSSPLLADSGQRFKDGAAKSKIRLIFEAAFDAYAAANKISNPAARRNG